MMLGIIFWEDEDFNWGASLISGKFSKLKKEKLPRRACDFLLGYEKTIREITERDGD